MTTRGIMAGGTAASVPFLQSGTGAVSRPVQTKLRETPSTTDWGTASQAVTALSAGGVVIVAAAEAPTLPATFSTIVFDYYGPATPANVYQESGETTRFAKRLSRGQQVGSHNGNEYSMQSFEFHPVGSGTNGPTHSDTTLLVVAQKKSFDTTSVVGEVDGINIVVRNGGTTSDSAAILANVATYGTGFMAAFESSTSIISGSVTQKIQSQVGVCDNVNLLYIGHYALASVGALTNAFRADTAGSATWAYLFRGFSLGTEKFGVDGNGLVGVGGATVSASTYLNLPQGTTAISSLRVPHGSAPTSPVNGDIWTTTAGLYVRINGATVGPLT